MTKPIDGRSGQRGRLTVVLGLVATGTVGFWLGRGGPEPAASAQIPGKSPTPATVPQTMAKAPATTPAAPPSDYTQRVVAYIYGSIPITREDLGEFLITRFGYDHIDLLVNKKIIERACEKYKIDVTEAEVEAAIEDDLKTLNGAISRKDFVDQILKRYGKTLYEWKQDIIRPRVMLTKLCKDRVKITDEELQKAYQAAHGPKVECRMILWPKGEERALLREYAEIRWPVDGIPTGTREYEEKRQKAEEAFDRKARSQAIPQLAAGGGKIQPIAHFAGVQEEVEKEAFSLRPGETSRTIGTPEGTIVLKCDKLIPTDASVKFEAVRATLYKGVFDQRIAEEIKKYMTQLREEAKPVFVLKKPITAQELERQVQQELGIQQTGAIKK
jgi:hypothetical protein